MRVRVPVPARLLCAVNRHRDRENLKGSLVAWDGARCFIRCDGEVLCQRGAWLSQQRRMLSEPHITFHTLTIADNGYTDHKFMISYGMPFYIDFRRTSCWLDMKTSLSS